MLSVKALLQLLAVTGIGLFVYSYALYPVALSVAAAFVQLKRDILFVFQKADRRGKGTNAQLPPVAVVISAFNEEKHLAARIDNLLQLDYPAELLRCYIGSDGSRDGTSGILSSCNDARILGHVFLENRGKASVLNDLVARGQEPIVVFSDANTFFDAQALRHLVRHFEDTKVGCVSGELRLKDSSGNNQDGLYWKVEQFLKFFEARIHGLLGANGAIYAIRREHWQPLSPDTICDDFCIAMNVSAKGGRLVYEPAAWAEEDTPDHISDEYERRVRIGIGNFQAFYRHPAYVWKTSWATRFAYVSHKVLRWFGPHLLVMSWLASWLLAFDSPFWAVMAALQSLGYVGAAGLYRLSQQQVQLPSLAKIFAFLFALNWAFLVASWRYATGQYGGSWRRTSR